MLKIDSHSHIIPEKLPHFAKKFGYGDFIYLEHHRKGYANMIKGGQFFREIEANCWDPQIRIEEYASNKTQVQVICTIPVMFSYWAKAKDGLEIARFLNDDIAATVNANPKNYIGLGTLPMQDTNLAIKELERCKEIGLVGVQIGSNINDKNLNEDAFFPIFKACQDLDMAVFIHPWNMMGFHSMEKYWLPWLVGMPAETSRAICSMVFSGVFQKLPKLRVNFAHSGGAFIPTIGRIQHGYNCRPDLCAIDNDVSPIEHLGLFWVDNITHDPKLLKYIIETIGIDKITLGSDYPFPLGDLEIGAFVEEMGIGDDHVNKIFCDNTLDWLNLDKKDFILT